MGRLYMDDQAILKTFNATLKKLNGVFKNIPEGPTTYTIDKGKILVPTTTMQFPNLVFGTYVPESSKAMIKIDYIFTDYTFTIDHNALFEFQKVTKDPLATLEIVDGEFIKMTTANLGREFVMEYDKLLDIPGRKETLVSPPNRGDLVAELTVSPELITSITSGSSRVVRLLISDKKELREGTYYSDLDTLTVESNLLDLSKKFMPGMSKTLKTEIEGNLYFYDGNQEMSPLLYLELISNNKFFKVHNWYLFMDLVANKLNSIEKQ